MVAKLIAFELFTVGVTCRNIGNIWPSLAGNVDLVSLRVNNIAPAVLLFNKNGGDFGINDDLCFFADIGLIILDDSVIEHVTERF